MKKDKLIKKDITTNNKSKKFGFKDFFYLISFVLLVILHVFLMENYSWYETIMDLISEIL